VSRVPAADVAINPITPFEVNAFFQKTSLFFKKSAKRLKIKEFYFKLFYAEIITRGSPILIGFGFLIKLHF